ncbi:MAG: hypothetical protein HGA51_10735 [Demequinaceae bacterium]|nr:hypothetical protein [Demequinaceae bacterium]
MSPLRIAATDGFDRGALAESLLPGGSLDPLMVLIVGRHAEDGDHGVTERWGRPSWDDVVHIA